MKVRELFDVKYGVNLELMSLEVVSNNNIDGVNFVARTSANNGVVARVKRVDGIVPQPAGILSCAGGGSVLSTFVQTEPFYSGRDLYTLSPKVKMTLQEKLYYCMCIKANAYRYNYGRQANKTLKDIELPANIPDWIHATPVQPLKTAVKSQICSLNVDVWKAFPIKQIFPVLENCKCNIARDLSDGNDCDYVGAKKSDNGIMRRVAYDKNLITKGNCIVFICDGQGSVGYSNYMDKDFIGSTTLTAGYNEHLNKYIGMFLVTVLDLERPKYSFGRKYRTDLSKSAIRLPVDQQGNPDWAYMENYIKSLPYSDRI